MECGASGIARPRSAKTSGIPHRCFRASTLEGRRRNESLPPQERYLLAVATALRERYKDKPIIIAGDDDHRLENNPGRTKALLAAATIKGVAIFPKVERRTARAG